MISGGLIVTFVLALFVIIVLAKTAVVVPQQNAYVVERLGKFSNVLGAGFHFLMPFFDVIRYRHSLKETAIDIPEQICITRDNVQVGVDGILYLKVLDPARASYGIQNYNFAITQLAQTTLRSEVGKIDLDRTFEERMNINVAVVSELDKASEPWGVKVLRYEIKNITPPKDILAAMEKQMRAEREKRATILQSEGVRDSAINTAEGEKQRVIKESEAKRQQQINEADGEAAAILAVASATSEGLRKVAAAINEPGGYEAVQLRVAEQYIPEFGKLAKQSNTMILPLTASDVASMVALATNVIKKTDGVPTVTPPPAPATPQRGTPYPRADAAGHR
jgi:regulator of protease activity HflC (stomatin/prohibitin superfamily)